MVAAISIPNCPLPDLCFMRQCIDGGLASVKGPEATSLEYLLISFWVQITLAAAGSSPILRPMWERFRRRSLPEHLADALEAKLGEGDIVEWYHPPPTRMKYPVAKGVRHFKSWADGGLQAVGIKILPLVKIDGQSVVPPRGAG